MPGCFRIFQHKRGGPTFEKAEDGAPMAQSMGSRSMAPHASATTSPDRSPDQSAGGNIAGPVFLPDGKNIGVYFQLRSEGE